VIPHRSGAKMLATAVASVLLALLAGASTALATPPAQTPADTATPAAVGILTGQLLNRTTQQPVPDVTVRLRRWQMEVEQPPLTTVADSLGQYRFDGLDVSSHAFYRAEADYQGITFRSEFVAFQTGVTQTVATIPIYETTDRADTVTAQRFHFIIMAREPGILSILELYQFANQADRAFVGTLNANGQRETMRIATPPGAQDLVLQSGTLGVDFVSRPGELAATTPLLPGEETFDVAFVYLVPYDTPSLVLDRPMHYDTLVVNGLLMDVGAELVSDALEFVGEREAQGQNFLQFNGRDIKADQTLPILLQRLDSIRFANRQEVTADTEEAVANRLDHGTLMLAMLGLGVGVIALGGAYHGQRRRSGATVTPAAEDVRLARERLLLTIVRLDEAYEAGQISASTYRRARAHRKDELARLWHRDQDNS